MIKLFINAHADGWVTINGVHVLIEKGKVTKGPAKFIGSSLNDLPGGSNTGKYKKSSTTTPSKSEDSKSSSSGSSTSKSTSSESKGSDSTPEISQTMRNYAKKQISEMTDSEVKKRAQEVDKVLNDPSVSKSSTAYKKAYAEKLAIDERSSGSTKPTETKNSSKPAESKKSGTSKSTTDTKKAETSSKTDSSSSAGESKSAKSSTPNITKTANGEETFTVDGVKYYYKVLPDGTAQITYDSAKAEGYGGRLLYGFNSPKTEGFRNAQDAVKNVMDHNKRIADSKRAEAIAQETGGVALYTGKVIKPGSVKATGVKDNIVQYSAVDAVTGKTINMTDADMGAALVAGIDFKTGASSTNPFVSSGSKSSSTKPSTTSKATVTSRKATSAFTNGASGSKSSSTPKVGVAGFTKAQNAKFAKLISQGMSESEATAKVLSSSSSRKGRSGFNSGPWFR